MKRTKLHSFCILLVLVMLFTTAGAAIAAPSSDGPVVSAPSGGGSITTTLIPVSKLPGTVTNAAGTIFPQGHESGDLKFGGDGVKISGLVGSATLSFTLKNFTLGWSGNVYQFMNGQWVMLPTTITPKAESTDGVAASTIYSDGIYVLIISYATPEEKGVKECVDIQFIYPDFNWVPGSDDIPLIGGYVYPAIPVGTSVRYELIHIYPDGDSITGDLSASGIVTENILEDGRLYSYVEFPEGTVVTSSYDWWTELSFTVRFYTMGCYKDFNWPSDFN